MSLAPATGPAAGHRRSLPGAVAAAILVVVACAAPAAAPPATPSEAIGPAVSPTPAIVVPTPTPTSSATLAPIAGLGDLWEPVPAGFDGEVASVTAGGPGWVAVGAAVWTSTDGRAWIAGPALLDDDPWVILLSSNPITGVLYAAGDEFYLASQSAPGMSARGAVWRSTDGLAWESVGSAGQFDLGYCFEGCPGLRDIVAGPGGVIITGNGVRGTTDRTAEVFAAVWFSPDGRRWEPLDGALPGLRHADFLDITPWGSGFVATGMVDGRPVTWSSGDGRKWTQPRDLPLPDDLLAGEDLITHEVAANRERLVAWGTRCLQDACSAVFWTSPDGVAWSSTRVGGPGLSPGWPGVRAFAATDELFVVLGISEGRWTTWTSSDGESWVERRSVGLAVPGELMYLDLALGQLGAILVGTSEPEGAFALVSPWGGR